MKKICVLLMMCGLSSVSFAQVQSDLNLDTSNVFKSNDKSSDSLLREISKKQMLLEIRKIEKEIEKLEKPEVSEKEKEVKAPPQDPVIYPAATQAQMNQQMQMQMQTVANQAKASNVVVFSVLGLGDKLQAKVGIDNRGGYIVSKGDILPNGAKVINVTYDYIVISKNKNAKTGEKIYVTGNTSVSNDIAPPPQNANGSSVIPMGMPAASPNLNTFGSVSTPSLPNANSNVNVNAGNTNVSTSSPGQATMPDVKGGFMNKIGG